MHDINDPKDDPIRKAFWTYTTPEDVLREINGRAIRDVPDRGLKAGDLLNGTKDLQADGSTSAGCWIYSGVFSRGENLSKRRDARTDPGGLGLPTWAIPGGRYVRARIRGEPPAVYDRIGPAFEELQRAGQRDAERPAVEFYRRFD